MMRRVVLALVLAAGFVLAAAPVHGGEPVVIDLRIDSPGVVTVGDRVTYTVIVEVDAGAGIALAPAALPPEVGLVGAPQTSRVVLDSGREQVTLTFQLAPFVPGEVMLPPLPLRYSNPDGTSGIVDTLSSVVDVTSVLPAAGQVTPRDLKPQAEIGSPPPTWPLPALAGLVAAFMLLLIAAFVRRRLVKRGAAKAALRGSVTLGPEDLTRALLDRAGQEFSASGDLVAYYTALGNAVRGYLTERYTFPAFALTTRELAAEMRRQELDRWQVRVASGLLGQCDAVIYARYRPAAERADADLTAAYEVVEMSRPQERQTVDEEGVPVS